ELVMGIAEEDQIVGSVALSQREQGVTAWTALALANDVRQFTEDRDSPRGGAIHGKYGYALRKCTSVPRLLKYDALLARRDGQDRSLLLLARYH
ncbi:MAG TPA: hypothetical protein VKV26_10750, partial [Dehalococcoidia bacterium]|nr:hypothetical protein [Dehalococcoidia bacterium]